MNRGPIFDPANPQRVSGVPVLPGRTDVRHDVACVEGGRDRDHSEMAGAFEIVCKCGYSTWTPWGQASAEEIARLHLWKVGARQQVLGS